MLHGNGHRPSSPSTPAVLTYTVQGISVSIHEDGSAYVGPHHFTQREAFGLAIALRMPGVSTLLNRIERTRQAAQLLDDDSDQAHDRR